MMPARRVAAPMRAVCSGVPPTGFSQNRCLPASAAAMQSCSWSMFGAVTVTTSTSGCSTTRRQSPLASSKPNEDAASSQRAATLSAHTTSRGSYVRSGNSVGMRRYERLWAWPIHPKPITPTPIELPLSHDTRGAAPPEPPWPSRSLALAGPDGFAAAQPCSRVVIGTRGSVVIPAQDSRTQWWAGSSQNAIERSSPGPASTLR